MPIAVRDSGLSILARLRDTPGDLGSFLWDYGQVRSRVRTGEGDARRFQGGTEPTVVDLKDVAGKSAVVEFGPGRFKFDPKSSGAEGSFHVPGADVQSLEIRGAGMDQTILDGQGLWAFFCAGKMVENLYLHDFTFDGGSNRAPFLDLRGSGAVIVENVRFRNLPTAGAPAPLAATGDMFLGVKGCVFEGSGLDFGSALSVRGSAVALLEGCRFSRLACAVIPEVRSDSCSFVNLLDCDYEDSPVVDRSPARRADGTPALVIRVRGARISFGPAGADPAALRKAWGADDIAEATGLEFSPGKPVVTLKEMIAALDRLGLPEGQAVAGIRFEPDPSGGPCSWVVGAVESKEGVRKERHYLLPAGTSAPEELPRSMRAVQVPPPERMEGALPLAQVLRASGLSGERAATEAAFAVSVNMDGRAVPGVYLRAPRGWPHAILNGLTGQDMTAPR